MFQYTYACMFVCIAGVWMCMYKCLCFCVWFCCLNARMSPFTIDSSMKASLAPWFKTFWPIRNIDVSNGFTYRTRRCRMYVARWLWHENCVHGTALGQGSSTFKKCPNDTWSEPSKQPSPNEAVHAAAQAVMSGTHDCCMAPSRKEVCMWMQCAKSCCAHRCNVAWIKLHHPRHAGCSLLIHPRNKYQPAIVLQW